MTSTATSKPPRPRGVNLVVLFGVLQALVLALIGALLFVATSDPQALADAGATRADAWGACALLGALAIVQLAAAIGLFRGIARVRSLYGVVATLQIGAAMYALVALRDVQVPSLIVLAIAVGILWLLYGSEATQEFFA